MLGKFTIEKPIRYDEEYSVSKHKSLDQILGSARWT